MAKLFLIRHGHCVGVSTILNGRVKNPGLSVRGREQIDKLGDLLSKEKIRSIFHSPLRRTSETAERLAAKWSAHLYVCEELNEVDFGDWAGKPFEELENDNYWLAYNRHRLSTRPPRGEISQEVLDRCLQAYETAATLAKNVAFVSHAEPLRYLFAYQVGLDLRRASQIELRPGGYLELNFESRIGKPHPIFASRGDNSRWKDRSENLR